MASDDNNNQDGTPTKQQLYYLMQRYNNIKLIPIDNHQEPIVVSGDAAKYNKPIFAVPDCGKAARKIHLALQYQGAFAQDDPDGPSRILVEGNLNLVNNAFNTHKKLLGDDPYNPQEPFEHPLMLMEGYNIPEYQLNKLISEDNIDNDNDDKDNLNNYQEQTE